MCLLLPYAAINAVRVEIAYNRALVDGIEAATAVIAAVLSNKQSPPQASKTNEHHAKLSHTSVTHKASRNSRDLLTA